MSIAAKLFKPVDGWKTVIAYVLAQIPWFTSNPLIMEAVNKVMENPADKGAWVNLFVQILLLVGIADIVRKNLTLGTTRVGSVNPKLF